MSTAGYSRGQKVDTAQCSQQVDGYRTTAVLPGVGRPSAAQREEPRIHTSARRAPNHEQTMQDKNECMLGVAFTYSSRNCQVILLTAMRFVAAWGWEGAGAGAKKG